MNILKPGTPTMDAYLKVKKAISQQSFTPGKILTENLLCNALQLGRSPVRAALQQLAQDGYVELPPNRSARVAQFTQSQVQQLYSLRGMMLCHALEMTVDAYTENDLNSLSLCLDRQEAAFRDYDFEAYLSAVYDFFFYIIKKANNPYLDEMADGVLRRINVFLCLYDNFYSAKKLNSLPLHRKILKGIEQKKPKVVAQAHQELSNRILGAYDYMILHNAK